MKIKTSKFIQSAVYPKDYPDHDYPEIAFIGRSNVGKSSLINMLLDRKNLAKVSSTPGKTALVNFFDINEEFCFVDLPGYGYAKRSKKELKQWDTMIERYLSQRENLVLFFILLDIRRVPNDKDLQIIDWLNHFDKNYRIIITKIDKVNQKTKHKQLKSIVDATGHTMMDLFLTSSFKRTGRKEILNEIQHTVYVDYDSED